MAALPGIVGRSIGLPDVHSGYGFAIGNVAAFDMADPEAVVSPGMCMDECIWGEQELLVIRPCTPFTCTAGGVGFDINCGVRLIRTNLTEKDVAPVKEQLTQSLFDHIPVGTRCAPIVYTHSNDMYTRSLTHHCVHTNPGVGSKGVIPTSAADLEAALEMGMDWSLREGYAWAEDKEHCEEYGRMLQVRAFVEASCGLSIYPT